MAKKLQDIRAELMRLVNVPEWLATRTGKELALLDMVRSRKYLGFSYYVVYTCDAIHLIDTNDRYNARRFSFDFPRYVVVEASLGLLILLDSLTGKEYRVFMNGQLFLEGIKYTDGFTTDGSRANRSIGIRYDYGYRSTTIKMSHLVAGLLEGEIAVFAMGHDRVLDTHHKDRNHKRDSRSNIQLATTDEHKEIHRNLRKGLDKK